MPAASYHSVVQFPPEEVSAWHERQGALRRLLPPWLPLVVVEEPVSLQEGRAVIGLPGGLRWVLRHSPAAEGTGFTERAANLPFELAGWKHTRVFSLVGERSTLVEDRAESRAPASVLTQVLAYAHRQLAGDLSAHSHWPAAGAPSEKLVVAMTGSSGLIGSQLAAFLTSGGHRVVRLVRRRPASTDERQWDPQAPAVGLLAGIDAVVHLAGAPIGRPFSEHHKRAVWESRVGPTERLARAAARDAAGGQGPACFVCASAVGFYGPARGDEPLHEESGQGSGFLARLVGEWESATTPAAEAGLRVVNVRTGVALSPRGGVLGLTYPAFLAGFGARLGSGRQWLSWIGVDDLLDVYLRALFDTRVSGPVNAVSPTPVTNAEFTEVLARVLRRPALLTVPSFAAGLVLGAEGAREFALASQRALPAALGKLGHRFRYPELIDTLRHVLGRWELAAGEGRE